MTDRGPTSIDAFMNEACLPESADPNAGRQSFSILLTADIEHEQGLSGFRAILQAGLPLYYFYNLTENCPQFLPYTKAGWHEAQAAHRAGVVDNLQPVEIAGYAVIPLGQVPADAMIDSVRFDLALKQRSKDELVTLLHLQVLPDLAHKTVMRPPVLQ